jgi:hypothetical protein
LSPFREFISAAICIANSLVGAKISACTFFPGVNFSIKGIPKAAVLPVPVAACPMTFFSPSSNRGITLSWIGDGVTNHFFVSASNVFCEIPRSLNSIIFFVKNKKSVLAISYVSIYIYCRSCNTWVHSLLSCTILRVYLEYTPKDRVRVRTLLFITQ